MRISDWSSDVCSSDLSANSLHDENLDPAHHNQIANLCACAKRAAAMLRARTVWHWSNILQHKTAIYARSEEHTSELQSLMRISSAVICLKKKKIIAMNQTDINIMNLPQSKQTIII